MVSEQLFRGGAELQDGHFLLKVSRDRLQAVVVPKDAKAGIALDLGNLSHELQQFGVVSGILQEPEMLTGGGICVAKGKPPEPGENSKVKLHVKPAVVHVPKRKDPDKDEVDYRELGNIVNVTKDRLLVEKIPPTQGIPGKDVFGTDIPSKPGKDRKLKFGKGVRISDDETRIYSTRDGKFVMAEGKPSVFGEHTVSGDVDLTVGNIAFGGEKLVIQGEVLPGFSIKCRGDIVIQRGVNNGNVMAGGALEVMGPVVGEETVLRSKGDLTVEFVENGPVLETAGELIVRDFIVQGKARVGKDLKALQGKGTIIGGRYIIAGSLHVKDLGSEAEIVTDISVGIVPSMQERKQKLDEELQLWSERMNELIKNISALEKMKKDEGGNLPEDREVFLKKCQVAMPKAMDKVNDLTEQHKLLEEELGKMVDESVYVHGKLYPGVTIKIGSAMRTMTAEEEQVVVHFDKPSRQIFVRKMSRAERGVLEGQA